MSEIVRNRTTARMSKIVCHNGVVYLCGQTAHESASSHANISAQVEETLNRVDALLLEAGSDRGRILSATIYLRDISDFAAMNEVWESWVPAGAAPARSTVEARLASENLLIEVTVTAALA